MSYLQRRAIDSREAVAGTKNPSKRPLGPEAKSALVISPEPLELKTGQNCASQT
ncbi:hypothetical protein EYZ11_009749 [Aspergillus tanneri]|uniref:Uncharacterized protein n=1 Tax=Aspergillus tanneri TaxID=1220188 RepID=A0A4S3J7D6_9EURO|nr:hypothetical protein EYZ11_009749 [Aspergillus tanneri]